MLIGEKLKFKSRKGQWRKRAIAQIEEMVREPFCQSDQSNLDAAAKLTRMGILGEKHLADAIRLDFSIQMLHDIRMMLLVIAAFSKIWRGHVASAALVYEPSEALDIWESKSHYADWTIATRRTWQRLMKTIERIG